MSPAADAGEVGLAPFSQEKRVRQAPLLPAARALFAIYYLHLGGMLSGFMNREQFDHAIRTDLELVLTGLASK